MIEGSGATPTRSCGSRERRRPRIDAVALLSLAALIGSIACGSSSSSTSVAPSPVRCEVAAAPKPAAFPASGGSGVLSVSAARECSWSVVTQADWIALAAPTQGQGSGSVEYTVAPNTSASGRAGTVAVGSVTATITQQAAACRFELSRQSFELGANAAGGDVDVRAAAGCAWTATAGVPWITIIEGAQGTGPGRVRFRIASNPTLEPRSGSLDVAGVRVEVRQLGVPCSYAIDPAGAEAGPAQTEGTLSVQTDAVCPWTAISDQPWLTVMSGEEGRGAGQVRYRAAANAGGSTRTGRIDVNGSVFTLVQAACRYGIDPSGAGAGPGQTDGTISVETDPGCAWRAASDQGWLTISAGENGSGPGEVRYRAAANEGASSRTGRITVNGQVFTLQQDACRYEIDPRSATFGAIGGDGQIRVETSRGCSWSAQSSVSWIAVATGARGSGDGRVTYIVQPNLAGGGRTGQLTVAGQQVVVTQGGDNVAGTVRDVEGSCPQKRFRIRSQRVRTTPSTVYEGGSCGRIRNGVFLRAKGIVESDGVLRAAEVDF